MNKLACVAVSLNLVACLTPRSMVFGQTAAIPAPGTAQVGLSGGFNYQTQSVPEQTGSGTSSFTSTTTTGGITFPAIEGNLEVGLNDMIAIGVHTSSAGIQPGIKLSFPMGDLRLAVLPEAALGLVNASSTTSVTSGGTTQTTTGNPSNVLSFLIGAKVIVSHSIGFYGGIGYDFQSYSVTTNQNVSGGGTSGTNAQSIISHNVAFAVGWDFALPGLHLRPEVAVIYSPAGTSSTTQTSGTTTQTVTNSGATAFVVMPCLTIVGGSFGTASTAEFVPPPPPH